jgi:hypothetical protein
MRRRLRIEGGEMNDLIAVYDNYLKFLNEANESPIYLAYAHDWRCPQEDLNKGAEYRMQIGELKKKYGLATS